MLYLVCGRVFDPDLATHSWVDQASGDTLYVSSGGAFYVIPGNERDSDYGTGALLERRKAAEFLMNGAFEEVIEIPDELVPFVSGVE